MTTNLRRLTGGLLLITLGTLTSVNADLIYSNSLRNGPLPEWKVTAGKWEWTDEGLSNARYGENRIFLDVLEPTDTPYKVELEAQLEKGPGWALYFGADLDRRNAVSGFSFQYDPGWDHGAYLLRQWSRNRERVVEAVRTSLDFDPHKFLLEVGSDSFKAYQDGELVLSYEGDLSAPGTLLGLRTWSNTDAVFRDFSVSRVPEPATLVALAIGCAVWLRFRR